MNGLLHCQRRVKLAIAPLLLLMLITPLGGCRGGGRGADQLAEGSSAAQQLDTNLTFNNITLEQPDAQGRLVWKVKAQQAIYTPDKAMAKVKSPYGQIYQDGQPIYRIQAQEGEVRQDGERILLRGKVVATDAKTGAVLQGDELEWRPKPDIMIIRNNLRGADKQVKLSANEAKIFNRQRRMELSGQVIALSKDPDLQIQAEHLVWDMDKKRITSDRPSQIQRLKGKTVTEQANSDKAEVKLDAKTVQLTQNARLTVLQPPMQVTGNSLLWNLTEQRLVADQPVTITQRQQQVVLTADRGRMNLDPKVAYLTGNVTVVGQRNQSKLNSDSLTWTMATQGVEADGNVVYVQATNPPMTLRGPRAVGHLDNQVVVVSGGRVVTEIIPEGVN